MENASKALLIAGEILIGVLLLTLLVFAFNSMGSFSDTISKNIDERVVYEFNTQFDVYLGRRNLTAQDIVTFGNLARSYNQTQESEQKGNEIIVSVQGVESKYSNIQKLNDTETYDFIQKHSVDNKSQFECQKIEYSKNTGKVNKVYIKIVK